MNKEGNNSKINTDCVIFVGKEQTHTLIGYLIRTAVLCKLKVWYKY